MKQLMKQKRGAFGVEALLSFGLTIVLLGIVLAVGLQILGETKDDMTANSVEANATEEAITALAKIPSKLGMIVTVVIAAILIGILMTYLYFKMQ